MGKRYLKAHIRLNDNVGFVTVLAHTTMAEFLERFHCRRADVVETWDAPDLAALRNSPEGCPLVFDATAGTSGSARYRPLEGV